jgi:hypothetical protein
MLRHSTRDFRHGKKTSFVMGSSSDVACCYTAVFDVCALRVMGLIDFGVDMIATRGTYIRLSVFGNIFGKVL